MGGNLEHGKEDKVKRITSGEASFKSKKECEKVREEIQYLRDKLVLKE